MKIRPVGAELFHTEGQKGRRGETVTFRSFANAPKILHAGHTVYSCVIYVSLNKQRLFLYAALTDWFS
jgi:hypothetical protein